MLNAVIVRGWRHDEIDRIYDVAANSEEYYFNPDLPPSQQKDYGRLQSQKVYKEKRQWKLDLGREYERATFGKNNQRLVFKAVLRHAARLKLPMRLKAIDPQIFDAVYDFLVQKGKLRQPGENRLTGQQYYEMCQQELARREEARKLGTYIKDISDLNSQVTAPNALRDAKRPKGEPVAPAAVAVIHPSDESERIPANRVRESNSPLSCSSPSIVRYG
jgi:hypothetical protein